METVDIPTDVCTKCGYEYPITEMYRNQCQACSIGLNDFETKEECEHFIATHTDVFDERILVACTQFSIPSKYLYEDSFWKCEDCGEVYESVVVYDLNGFQVKVRTRSSCLCSLID